MKLSLRMCLLIFIMLSFQNAWALTITAPTEGETFFAGTRVDIIVRPDSGETWERVLLEIVPMAYNPLTGQYKETIQIPPDTLGNFVITVIAADTSGKVTKFRRNIISRMPPNVALKSIIVNKDFMLLYKLPEGSPPEDIKRIESRQLSVRGVYSDNVKRNITSSASGTTYESNNEKIVAVSPDGKITAKGLGETKIRVRNGLYSAHVNVVVRPYRQPER